MLFDTELAASMLDDSDDPADLEQEFEKCKKQDCIKNALIQKLFEREARLRQALRKTESKLRKEEDLEELYRARAERYEAKSRILEQKISGSLFVLVLIDGDCMPFEDRLLAQAKDGGHQAAILLRLQTEKYIRDIRPDWPHDLTIVTRVYANITGLSKASTDARIVPDSSRFEEFVRGFNMEHPLFDFLDSGSGKECADERLKENFKLYVNNVHCRHIVFGGSADNGYARLLGPYSRSSEITDRVTLLQGPPFAKEMAELAGRFQTTTFDGVFRQRKIVSGRVSFQAEPLSSPAPRSNDAPEPESSFALIAAAPTPAPESVWGPSQRQKSSVLKNALGQRVDKPLYPVLIELLYMRANKHCLEYTKFGYCEYGSRCEFKHDPALTDDRLEALRFLARALPCKTGLFCSDPECWYGHQCSKQDCKVSKCRFKRSMHGIDTKVV